MTKNNYCESVYKGIYISIESEDQARVGSCCINQTEVKTQVIDFDQNPFLVEQRRAFDQGRRPPSCDNCWRLEDQGLPSRRLNIKRQEDLDPTKVELIEMHYNVAPICNAKCITCGSHYSSMWAQEDQRFGTLGPQHRPFHEIRQSRPQFNLDYTQLRQIYFNGGEPFLSRDVTDILTAVKTQTGSVKDLGLVINTNASVQPTAQDLALWSECRAVTLICSIEATGPEFEYIRYPLEWKTVEHNIRTYPEIFGRRITIQIAPNLGIHNALSYGKLVEWFHSLEHPNCRYRLEPNQTVGSLGFDTVSKGVKAQLRRRLPKGPEFDRLRSMIWATKQGQDTEWVGHLDRIDQRRNQNWRATFPELAEILDSCSAKRKAVHAKI